MRRQAAASRSTTETAFQPISSHDKEDDITNKSNSDKLPKVVKGNQYV
jgi:hypothetical protein